MSVNSITNDILYNSALLNGTKNNEESLLEELASQKEKTEETKEAMLSPGRKLTRATSNASEALAELEAKGITVNRKNIASEIEQREAEFKLAVAASLKALGVDENIEFKLSLNEKGDIIVNTSNADKNKVQQFFDNNPAFSEEFKKIESLKNLHKNMESSQGMSQTGIRRSIQLENADVYLQGLSNGNDSYSPLILAYSKNSMVALAGVNINV